MGIGSQTVTSEQEYKDKNPGALSTKGQTNTRMVTLLVTPKQAEVLQLATQYGTVALTMRNPLDAQKVAQNVTKLSEFTSATQGFGMNLASWAAAFTKNPPKAAPRANTPDLFAASPTTKPVEDTNPLWEMLVVRGNTSEKRTFPLSEVNQPSKPGADAEPPNPQTKSEPEPAASLAPVRAAKG
jgi:hypothetical protein